MSVTPELVKELRARTGAGISDCMQALRETGGDLAKAADWLQEKGAAKAAKKAGVIATEGVAIIRKNENKAVVFEINAQTDFVAGNEEFLSHVLAVGDILLDNDFSSTDVSLELRGKHNKTIAELCVAATAKIGEKIILRRAISLPIRGKNVGSYIHTNKRIAALVVLEGGTPEAAHNVAMHIASMNPQFLSSDKIPADEMQKIRDRVTKNAAEDEKFAKKPENIRTMILEGMVKKELSELTLLDQEFVMDKMSVGEYLTRNKAKAVEMIRFEVGEGLEKACVNFAEEVKAQMK